MDAGYDALEEAASSFAKNRDRPDDDARSHRSHRDRDHDRDRGGDRDRDRERRHRDRDRESHRDDRDDRHRGDRDRERERDRDGHRDRDRDRERDRDRDRYDRYERDRERGDRVREREREYDERPRRRRREDDEYGLAAEPMGGGAGGGVGHRDRRPRYDDPHAEPMRGYSSPPRRRRDDDDWRGGRDRERDRRGDGGRRGSPGRSPTPPGTVPLEERHVQNSQWDVRPAQFANVGAMEAKMTGMFTYGPGRVAPPSTLGVPQQVMAGSFPPSNPVRQTKRLYVGGINDLMTERSIQEFLNGLMRENKLAAEMPGEPVASCQINRDKNFAFVEFRTADEATAALQFDGVMCEGTPLRVRRPKDYNGTDPVSAQFGSGAPGIVDSPNKLFIGGLPTYLNDEQVMELLKAFGELKSFNLVKESAGVSKGFAFCEYMDPNVTDMAIQGLHNFALGDRVLVVQRAAVGRNQPPGSHRQGQDHHQHAMPGSAQYLQRTVPSILQNANDDAPTTRVMLLLNMVTPEELYSDQDYEEILEDINDECSKYGEVEGVRIPRPVPKSKKWLPTDSAASTAEKNRKIDEENGVGRVYVMYKDVESTRKAMKAIGGRQFGGRTILVANVSEEEFLGPAPPPPPEADEEGSGSGRASTAAAPDASADDDSAPPPPPPAPPAEADLDAAAADAVKDIMADILG
ncbi:splicing factor U2AF 65 kDa subunit [Kwoniella heveanensis CBS 569]|nr:splicing factor U2AF 65 kDa subunit [Kwoniella heveanensis CBS 569]